MRIKKIYCYYITLLLCVCFSVVTQASTRLSATRVIIYEQNKEGSISILGDPQADFLIQSWIDAGLKQPVSATPLPFAIVPNLVHLQAKQEQRLRILYQGSGLPPDRESVFWLNVQEIPQSSDKQNVLQLAVRQRLKIFFRPLALGDEKNEAISSVEWSIPSNNILLIHNPTPYHISFGAANIQDEAGVSLKDVSIEMLPPFSDHQLPFDTLPNAKYLVVDVINDYGNATPYRVTLTQSELQKAVPVPTDE